MMTLYPDIQRKAQEEIDMVVGKDRLPTFADRENLPYVDAVINEVLRFNPVAPLGTFHCNDEYESGSASLLLLLFRYTAPRLTG